MEIDLSYTAATQNSIFSTSEMLQKYLRVIFFCNQNNTANVLIYESSYIEI